MYPDHFLAKGVNGKGKPDNCQYKYSTGRDAFYNQQHKKVSQL